MENQEIFKKEQELKSKNNSLSTEPKDNILLKGIVVIGLILAMLLPTPFIINLIEERAERQEKTIEEIGKQYGSNQTLYGPFIKLPYLNKNKEYSFLYLAPESLGIKGDLTSEVKSKGIYNAVLYQSKININADFTPEVFAQLNSQPEYDFTQAKLVFGISDINGLNEDIKYTINQKIMPSKIGGTVDMGETKTTEDEKDITNRVVETVLTEEYEIPISIPENKSVKVSFPLSIKGSGKLNFIPLANRTNIEIKTKVKDLSFHGNSSYSETIKDNFRVLIWKVSSKGKNQIFTNTNDLFKNKNKFGMTVLQSYNEYSKTNRVAKYSILFIGLTFLTFFFIEIINKLKIHPVQYVLVGLALSVFYLLLLSISEYIGFNSAYAIAAVATVVLICWFVKGIVKTNSTVLIVLVVLAFLYSYIFVIIQLGQLALLAGSIGLFVILALLMYFSRKIDWKTD